jgi:hypothetical protein
MEAYGDPQVDGRHYPRLRACDQFEGIAPPEADTGLSVPIEDQIPNPVILNSIQDPFY